MAVTVYVRDLVNYPDNQKTVTVNLSSLVPLGQLGDEKWVISTVTNAYADASNTAIQDIYITDLKRGWCRSSGLVGGTFDLAAGHKISVVIDGATGTTTVALASGNNLPGETVASDIQTKLRALAATGAAQAGDLGYKNCTVEFRNNKFWIYSGTVAASYTATTRSSVVMGAAATGVDARNILGLDITLTSYSVATNPCQVTELGSNYVKGAGSLTISAPGWTVASGQAYMITDGTNTDYFSSLAGSTGTTINVTSGVIPNDYSATATGTNTMVVLLTRGDDEEPVATPLETIDDAVSWGIMSITNQIYFAS